MYFITFNHLLQGKRKGKATLGWQIYVLSSLFLILNTKRKIPLRAFGISNITTFN